MNGAFYTGRYRNVFEELGYDKIEIQNRLEQTFQTIFYGDESERFYVQVSDDMGYLTDTGNHDVRTEGMSYGMMICVQMNHKEEFDCIWKWVKTYMWIAEGINKGYFAWSCDLNGKRNSEGAAPDGEEFFAMSLFFAWKRWGNGEGIYHYENEAQAILHAALHNQNTMWEKSNYYIKFITECDWSDPSYHLPHFYELYALWANEEDRGFFEKAAAASREYLKKACNDKTGLCAEYANYDGTPHIGHQNQFGGRHDWYYSDAYRVPANIGLDYAWFAKDKWECECTLKVRKFFADKLIIDEKGMHYGIYDIEGNVIEGEALHPVAIIATNAMSYLATEEPGESNQNSNQEAAVRLLWNTPLRKGDRRYYDNCLYMFAMLALSGNYRIY